MAVQSPPFRRDPPAPAPQDHRRRRRWPWAVLGAVVLVLGGAAAATLLLSGATLKPDSTALARAGTQPLAGHLQAVSAVDADGRAVALRDRDGVLTPRRRVRPGERITVRIVVRRPGWSAWLLGRTRTERLTVRAPVARPAHHYLTGAGAGGVPVAYDTAVARARYALEGSTRDHDATAAGRTVTVDSGRAAGAVRVRVAARAWETLGPAELVRWFPRSALPVALVSPAPGAPLGPSDPIRLTLSTTVRRAFGSRRPTVSPSVPGHWRQTDDHTLVFTPSGYGAGFGTHLHVTLPHTVAVAGTSGANPRTGRTLDWTVPEGSTLRLQQLLADAGYLPLRFKPAAGARVAKTVRAELHAAVAPPAGRLVWRYRHTPAELKALWNAGSANEITRGAVMTFQDEHGLDVDAVAGPTVFKELISDALHGRRHKGAYSYVYVHRDHSPQIATLWSGGRTVFSTPGNTGVAAAPTELGSFPVFEHLAETTMTGTNPDGSTYNDPGIKWVSYFNGGDALHAFDRASFGSPQSVGCVELPLAAAARIWPYTPIGTLVTIEH